MTDQLSAGLKAAATAGGFMIVYRPLSDGSYVCALQYNGGEIDCANEEEAENACETINQIIAELA